MGLINQDVRGLIAQFKDIHAFAEDFREKVSRGYSVVHLDYATQIDILIEEYADACRQFAKIIPPDANSKTELTSITSPQKNNSMLRSDTVAQLLKLSIASKKALNFLESINVTSNIPKEQLDKLESLRKELKEMKIEVDYERNLEMAVEEVESAHFLASSLISSRVIDRCMDAIPGDNDGDKIEFLVKKGTVKNDEKDVKSSILKAARLARNVLTHDLDIPTPKEAFSLLADGFKLAEIVSKMKLKVAANP